MTASPPDLLPEGLADRLPGEAALLTQAMRRALDVLASHSYARVRPPLIEFEHSLAQRMAGLSPQRMFRFVDPQSLMTLALRADMTPQVGRIAATSLAAAPRPLRLSYAGEVAVIRADQLDPARQRLQLGAELIGADTVAAAGEIALLAVEAAEAAGARGITVDFTLPDLVDHLAAEGVPAGDLAAIRRELDAKDAGGLAAAGGAAWAPLIHAVGPFADALARLRAWERAHLLASRLDGLAAIAERIGARARLTLDATERHGFEYQSWFGFTLYAANIGGALGRGGTYRIGGSDEAATGFSLYLDPLVDTLGAEDQAEAVDTLYLPLGHDPAIAARLRAIGWRTIAALDESDDPARLGCTHRLAGGEPVAV